MHSKEWYWLILGIEVLHRFFWHLVLLVIFQHSEVHYHNVRHDIYVLMPVNHSLHQHNFLWHTLPQLTHNHIDSFHDKFHCSGIYLLNFICFSQQSWCRLSWRNWQDRKKSSHSCQNTPNTSDNDLLAKIWLPHPNSEVLSLWLAFVMYPLFDVVYRL